MTEYELIEGYKRDFKKSTGKGLRCIITSMRVGDTNFISEGKIDIYTALDIILGYTEWNVKTLFSKSKPNELVLRRNIISFILVNNGCSMIEIGRLFNRDHSTIIENMRVFEGELEVDYYTQKLFTEILNNLKEHYNPKKLVSLQEFNKKYERDT